MVFAHSSTDTNHDGAVGMKQWAVDSGICASVFATLSSSSSITCICQIPFINTGLREVSHQQGMFGGVSTKCFLHPFAAEFKNKQRTKVRNKWNGIAWILSPFPHVLLFDFMKSYVYNGKSRNYGSQRLIFLVWEAELLSASVSLHAD